MTWTGEMSIKLRSPLSSYLRLSFPQTFKAVRRAGDDLWDDCRNSITTSAESLTDHQVYGKTSRINVWEIRLVPISALTLASPVSYVKGLVGPTRIGSVCYEVYSMKCGKMK